MSIVIKNQMLDANGKIMSELLPDGYTDVTADFSFDNSYLSGAGTPASPLSINTTTEAARISSAITTERSVATTLTNKRINPRIQELVSAATVTPNADTDDAVIITAQAAGLTLANWSGTPVQGQTMIVRIKDSGTARSIAFGTNYRAIGVTLPTTTVISKTLYLGLIYNSTDTKIDVVGINLQA